jgi:hypothetical protein
MTATRLSLAAAALIKLLHIVFIAFVLLAPFSTSLEALILHAAVVPFLFFHWALNDDTCFLTWLECTLRGVPVQASFMHDLVAPIYKLHDQGVSHLSWIACLLLWLAGLYRLRTLYGAGRDQPHAT